MWGRTQQKSKMSDTAVTKQDQENISNFAILADELRSTKQEIKKLEEYKVLLSDATDEAMLAHTDGSEDAAFFRMGDCFLQMNEDAFAVAMDRELENANQKLQQYKDKITQTHTQMVELKSELYSKFKDQISLEFE